MWRMRWLNKSVATINAMLQFLDIYRLEIYGRFDFDLKFIHVLLLFTIIWTTLLGTYNLPRLAHLSICGWIISFTHGTITCTWWWTIQSILDTSTNYGSVCGKVSIQSSMFPLRKTDYIIYCVKNIYL